jgi:hypothetical protein
MSTIRVGCPVFFAALVPSTTTSAATLTVGGTNDSGPGTLARKGN